MNTRWIDTQATYFRYGFPLVLGTTANMVSTYLTLPLQRIFNYRQLHSDKTYSWIFKDTFSRTGIKNVYNLTGTAMQTAVLQSVSFLGVSMVMTEVFKNDDPLLRGIKAGLVSATAESIFTAWGSQKMVSGWEHSDHAVLSARMKYWRSLQGTILKNAVANPTSFGLYIYANEHLKNHMNTTAASATAGVLSAFFSAPIIGPFSNLQTQIQNKPEQTLVEHFKQIVARSPRELWKGAAGRAGYKMADSLIKFGIIGAGQHSRDIYLSKNDERQAKHQL